MLRCVMHIISRKALKTFWENHADAEKPLMAWYKLVQQAKWQHFADVRGDYPSADQVGEFVVFNIGGNKYRLITRIEYWWQKIFVRDVLTHAEYDKGKWKNE